MSTEYYIEYFDNRTNTWRQTLRSGDVEWIWKQWDSAVMESPSHGVHIIEVRDNTQRYITASTLYKKLPKLGTVEDLVECVHAGAWDLL